VKYEFWPSNTKDVFLAFLASLISRASNSLLLLLLLCVGADVDVFDDDDDVFVTGVSVTITTGDFFLISSNNGFLFAEVLAVGEFCNSGEIEVLSLA
jgi:hypothetical protein